MMARHQLDAWQSERDNIMQNNNSGLPDPSFANGGLFRVPDVGQQQYVTALAPRRTGGILGVATARFFDSYYLYGLCADGTLDECFRGAGCFQDDFGQPAIARLLHARDDGKFLVAAELAQGVALARYEADGRCRCWREARSVWAARQGRVRSLSG
jgi:hypothetical protein